MTTTKKEAPKLVVPRHAFGTPHDNSNSQYALLGLSACMSAGVFPSPDTLQLAEKWWTDCQQEDGGWNYGSRGNKKPSYGSMTAGGVSSLAICLQGGKEKRDPLQDERVKRGITWLSQNLSFGNNPQGNNKWHYYWIYGVERAGSLAGTDFFDGRPWYYEGSNALVSMQNADGTWGTGENDGVKITDTCWAILFLRRASKQIQRKMVTYTQDSHGDPKKKK
jgi:hypothetical protein